MSKPPSHLPVQNPLKAAAYMALAMAAFPCNDTLMKLLAHELPVGTLIFVRGIFSSTLILLAIGGTGALRHLGQILTPAIAIRAVMDTISTLLFISALVRMPIANITSITQTVPLVVTGLAAVFLAERVGWRRLAAIAFGFVGVTMIVKPDMTKLDGTALLALVLVLTLAVRDILTRRIHGSVPALVVALANSLFVLTGAFILSIFEGGLEMPTWRQVAVLAAAGFFLALGYQFMVQTLRYADVSVSAPIRYTMVLWSLLSGIFIFREFPDRWALAGIGLVVASGLYTLHRESVLKRRTADVSRT